MIPVRIRDFTRWLGPPPEWSEEGKPCKSLAIRDVVNRGTGRAMESAWEPDPQERLAVAAGANVIFGVAGTVHPPIYAYAGEPPERYTREVTFDESVAVVTEVRALLNANGAAITEPREIVEVVRVLMLNAEARRIVGARPR